MQDFSERPRPNGCPSMKWCSFVHQCRLHCIIPDYIASVTDYMFPSPCSLMGCVEITTCLHVHYFPTQLKTHRIPGAFYSLAHLGEHLNKVMRVPLAWNRRSKATRRTRYAALMRSSYSARSSRRPLRISRSRISLEQHVRQRNSDLENTAQQAPDRILSQKILFE